LTAHTRTRTRTRPRYYLHPTASFPFARIPTETKLSDRPTRHKRSFPLSAGTIGPISRILPMQLLIYTTCRDEEIHLSRTTHFGRRRWSWLSILGIVDVHVCHNRIYGECNSKGTVDQPTMRRCLDIVKIGGESKVSCNSYGTYYRLISSCSINFIQETKHTMCFSDSTNNQTHQQLHYYLSPLPLISHASYTPI
jgi:hypothetical protein